MSKLPSIKLPPISSPAKTVKSVKKTVKIEKKTVTPSPTLKKVPQTITTTPIVLPKLTPPTSLPPMQELPKIEKKEVTSPVSLPPVKELPKIEKKEVTSPVSLPPIQELPKIEKVEVKEIKEEIVTTPPSTVISKEQKVIGKELYEYEKWREELKNFLRYKILPNVVSSPENLDKLVSDDAMKIWEVAFTSESYSPTQGENYEELELLGDKMLSAGYVKFLMASYPTVNRSQISELVTYYLAKPFQANLSSSLGIGEHIRSAFPNNTHILEDVFESFIGALSVIGDQFIKFGVGFGLVYNFTIFMYKDVEIDWIITLGNPKTRVKEVFESLGIIKPIEKEKVPESHFEDENGLHHFTVTIPNNGIELLKSLGISINSNILGSANGSTKKKAEIEAYRIALQTLNNYGVTQSFVEDFRKKKEFENPELAALVPNVLKRIEKEGYVTFYLKDWHVKSKISGQTTGKYVQLIGVDDKGRKQVLAMNPEPVDIVLNARKQILYNYGNYLKK